METKANLAKAIIGVMQDVKGIEKNLNVGSGAMSYKGVGDQDVKKIVGDAMAKHGLCIIPIGIDAKATVDRWEETTQYGVKMKQNVFTEATTKYLLLHESGEFMEVVGYGHGVDSQDKSAGKATTYALKYALLYIFLVPTGKIDDADNTHSDDIKAPVKTAPPAHVAPKEKPILKVGTPEYDNACLAVKGELADKKGGFFPKFTMAQLEAKYHIPEDVKSTLLDIISNL